MVKFVLIFVAVAVLGVAYAASDCPSYSQVQNCSPKCKDDTECSAVGGKCCPNLCNARSCVEPNKIGNSGNSYKQNAGGAGTYCGNVKCSSFEKCENDRSTKRPKCVRG